MHPANEGSVKLAKNKQSPHRTSNGNSNPCAHPETTSASQVRRKVGRWQKQKNTSKHINYILNYVTKQAKMIHYIVMLQNLCLEKLAVNSEKEVQYSGTHLKQVKNGINRKKI
jgi:hypothetical protein